MGQFRTVVSEAMTDVRHNYVEEIYPEIKLALEELAGEEFVKEGKLTIYHRSAPQLWMRGTDISASQVAANIQKIVELITAMKAAVHRSGKTTRSYTIIVPKCIVVQVDQIGTNVRVMTFESYVG